MRACVHCGTRVAMRPDRVWVHADTRTKFCGRGPIPRPSARPAVPGGDPRPETASGMAA